VGQFEAAVSDVQQPVSDDDDGDWNSWVCIAAATEQPTASDEMVGKAPTQLEPSDELMIRSDHEYYRTALAEDVVVSSEEEVVCEVEVSTDELKTESAAILPCTSDLDLSVLADQELWRYLEHIIDTDQLLGLCNMPPAIIPTPPQEKISSSQIQFSMEPSPKQDDKSLPIQKSNEGFDDVSSPLFDMMDTFSVEPWSLQSPKNHFEAGSSGIGSPFSDELVEGEDCGFHWEESFIELFPDLL